MDNPDGNVVVTTYEGEYPRARKSLEAFGTTHATPYHNVLLLQVDDIAAFLEALHERLEEDVSLLNSAAHILPLQQTFTFDDRAAFESAGKRVLGDWLDRLAGRSFHVRIHRRGFKYRLSSHAEEQALGAFVIDQLAARGEDATVEFGDPQLIVSVEIVGRLAGMSLWTREELRRYPFLGLD
jgi:tRNA(Ser,Leu) C12 N-acetylase TAN1